MEIEMVEISAIEIGERHRKEMGDLKGLADNIRTLGLLEPIGITADRKLVSGERRLRACRDHLGWTMIPACIIEMVERSYAKPSR